MDPISAAIVASIPVLTSDLVKSAVKDAYAGLKAVIARKWGDANPVPKAITDLEADPKSKGRAVVLEESVAGAEADPRHRDNAGTSQTY